MVNFQKYLIQQPHVKRSIQDKYNEFIESQHEFIDSTESESPSQITRLIVADHYVSPFLGICSRISITCAQFDERKDIEPLYCLQKKKKIMRKAINQDNLQSTTSLFLVVTKQE